MGDSGLPATARAVLIGAGIVGNTLVYLDKNHLTVEYSRLLAPAIGALADRALAHN